jgi:hypothetical protein
MSDRHVVRGDELLQDHVHRGITSKVGVTGGSVSAGAIPQISVGNPDKKSLRPLK